MKRMILFCMLFCMSLFAGEITISGLDVTASSAAALAPGADRDALTNAAAHTLRMDNPHLVTPSQIGAATATQGAKADTALQPSATNGLASAASVSNQIAAIPAPAGVPVWYDANSNYFATSVGGTGLVWFVSHAITTNFTVTIWPGFRSAADHLSPPFTNSAFPFVSGNWSGSISGTTNTIYLNFGSGSAWWTGIGTTYPLAIMADRYAEGSATVSRVFGTLVSTNLYTRLASTNDLSRYLTLAVVNADPVFNVVSNLTGLVTITNVFERPVKAYGTGAVVVAFSGLRDPLPVYCTFQGFSALHITNAYQVGSGAYQTNQVNHVLVWGSDSHVNVSAITTEDIQ